MKVFVTPTGLHSYAMVRVANALARYAPPHVQIVTDRQAADCAVLHVIGPDAPLEEGHLWNYSAKTLRHPLRR